MFLERRNIFPLNACSQEQLTTKQPQRGFLVSHVLMCIHAHTDQHHWSTRHARGEMPQDTFSFKGRLIIRFKVHKCWSQARFRLLDSTAVTEVIEAAIIVFFFSFSGHLGAGKKTQTQHCRITTSAGCCDSLPTVYIQQIKLLDVFIYTLLCDL